MRFILPPLGGDATLIKNPPERLQCFFPVSIESRFPYAEKLPTAALQLPLAFHICFVAFGPVPMVAVTFDCEPRLSALDHKIDSFARDFMLGQNGEILAKQFQGNIHLEPAFEWRGRVHNAPIVLHRSPFEFITINSSNLLRLCFLEEIKKLSPETSSAEVITGDGMEKNHPVAGAAGCNVETSFVGCLCERADPFVVGRNERQKHNVALVALKTVGIAADQASPFHFFRAKSFEQLILDQRSLCFSLKNNYSNRHFIVSAVITQFSYPCDDGLVGPERFRPVAGFDDVVIAAQQDLHVSKGIHPGAGDRSGGIPR